MWCRRLYLGLLMFALGSSLVLNACSSGDNGEELQQSLADQTYQLEFADLEEAPLLDCVTGLVPDASLSPAENGNNGTQSLSALAVYVGDITISFAGNEFTIEDNGEVISAGTWAAIDSETIDLTENGLSSPFGVTIDGETLILAVTQDTIDHLCSPDSDTPPQDDSNPDVSNDIEDPSQLALLLTGNWCYLSGYEFYHAFNISIEGLNPSGFVLNDALVIINDGDEPSTRGVGINEFLLSAWIDTNRLSSAFHRYAPITVDENDPSTIRVEFGDGKEAVYFRAESDELGVCEDANPAAEVPAAEVTQ